MGEIEQKSEVKQVKPTKNHQASSPSKTRIVISDFLLSILWAYTNSIIKLLVHEVQGLNPKVNADIVTFAFKIVNMFIFAELKDISKGGNYNPLSALAVALSSGLSSVLFTIAAIIPAQVFGAIIGVELSVATLPGIGKGPKLNVGISEGALTEGVLSFLIIVVSMELKKELPGSFFRKNWIASITKLTLNILGSDLTGGAMNPASAMGWAFYRGDYKTEEHLVVYWLAPMVATLLAVWVSKLLFRLQNDVKTKSE